MNGHLPESVARPINSVRSSVDTTVISAVRPLRAQRDSLLDLLRMVALGRIVMFHVYAQTWLTWIAAVPVMFFVAGCVLDGRHQPYRSFLLRRGKRLLLPFWMYGIIIALVSLAYSSTQQVGGTPALPHLFAWILPVVDPSTGAWTGGWLSSHLWYLRAYLWILVLSPLLRRAANHIAVAMMAVSGAVLLLEAAAALNVPYIGHGTIRVLLGDTLVFGFFATLGICYKRGTLHATVRTHTIIALIFGAGAVLFAVLIGIPDGGVNSSYPVLLLLGVAWLSAIAAAERPLRRVAENARVAVTTRRVSSRALTIYLWHPACIVLASHLVTGAGFAASTALLIVTLIAVGIAVVVFGWIESFAAQRPPALSNLARPTKITGFASITGAIVLAATIPLLRESWGVAASIHPMNSGSLAPTIPAPSARHSLENSAFAPGTAAGTADEQTRLPSPATTSPPAPTDAAPTVVAPRYEATSLHAVSFLVLPGAPLRTGPLALMAPRVATGAALLNPPSATVKSTTTPRNTLTTRRPPLPTTTTILPSAPPAIVAPRSTTPTSAVQIPQATKASTSGAIIAPLATLPSAKLPAAKLQAAFDAWRVQVQPAISSSIVSVRIGDETWTSRSADPGVTSRYLPDVPFMASSITKTFTATLVLREVERGVLKLDDPVPALTGLTVPVPAGITVRRLLTHTSGLVDYRAAAAYDASAALTPLDAVTLSLRTPQFETTGTTVSYANSNYLYLGLLVEQIEAKPYVDLLRELTTTVGLNNTRLNDAPKPGWIGFSSGGIVATAEDLAKWGQALFTPGEVLTARGVDMLTTLGDSNLGLGTWPACPCSTDAQGVKRYTAIGHQTADGGMFYFPATGITVVAMFEPIGHDTHARIVSLTAALSAALV